MAWLCWLFGWGDAMSLNEASCKAMHALANARDYIFLENPGWSEEEQLGELRDAISAMQHALQPCNWWEEDGAWTTGCARRFVLEAGTPSDNSMAYCCYCGSVIKEVQA